MSLSLWSTLAITEWLPKDGIGRLLLSAILGAVLAATFTAIRERQSRTLARRADVGSQFLTALLETLETRLQASRNEISTDALLVIATEMLRAEISAHMGPKKKLLSRIIVLAHDVRFKQPAPSVESSAVASARLIAAWVQHPIRTGFSQFLSK